MLLYHINFGFPLVSPDSAVYTNHDEVRYFMGQSSQTQAAPRPEEYQAFTPPGKAFSGLAFEMHKAREDHVRAEIENPKVEIRSSVKCNTEVVQKLKFPNNSTI